MFFCEATNGSVYNDHTIEVAAKVAAVPDPANITQRHYFSLMNTSRVICKVAEHKTGLMNVMLKGHPHCKHVFEELLSWIGDTVEEVNCLVQYKCMPPFPVTK